LIIAFRVGLLLLAAGAAVAAAAIGLAGRQSDDAGAARYVCPNASRGPRRRAGRVPHLSDGPRAGRPRAGGGGMRHGDCRACPTSPRWRTFRKHRIIDFLRRRSLAVNIRELRGPALVGDDRTLEAIFYNDQIAALSVDEAATFS